MAQTKREIPNEGPMGDLIDALAPINNKCRQTDGIDKVEHVWELGDALLSAVPDPDDRLLREINHLSYITRDLLRYGLIVRRSWNQRADLRRQFPQLARYTLFREALPFLKGDRCGIDDTTHAEIVRRLNEQDQNETKTFLKKLKQKAIGRTHSKGKAAARMADFADEMKNAVLRMFDLADQAPAELLTIGAEIGVSNLQRLSQLSIVIAEDSKGLSSFEHSAAWLAPFSTIAACLTKARDASPEDRSGFRKALGAMLLMETADLLNALRTPESFAAWKKRRKIGFSLK